MISYTCDADGNNNDSDSNSDEFWVMMLILNKPSSCDLNGDGDATLKP